MQARTLQVDPATSIATRLYAPVGAARASVVIGGAMAAPSAVERIAPADVQARRIGHFGFFREQFSQSLWPSLLDKLQRLTALTAVQQSGVAHTTA